MSRVLAIDYGLKRTGMAWTDTLQISITPLNTCQTEVFEDLLDNMLRAEDIGELVFGLPTHADGKLTKVGNKVTNLSNAIRNKFPSINVFLIDESFSSHRASQMLIQLGVKKKKRQQKGTLDQMSAVLILKDFLNTRTL